MAQLEENDAGPRVLEILTENGRLFNYTSISETLRFRLLTKRMNLVVRNSRNFRENSVVMGKNTAWPRVETQALPPPVQWTRFRFVQFPLEAAPASFADYWRASMVDRVRVIDLVQVRVHCDYIYRVLCNIVHLEEINFDKVSWIANLQLTVQGGRVRNIKNLCQFSHTARLLGRGEVTLRKISISRNHILPMCILNLLRHRSQGRLQSFAFNGGKLDEVQKTQYAPQWTAVSAALLQIVTNSFATLRKLEFKDFIDCTQILVSIDEAHRRYLENADNVARQLRLTELNLHKLPNPQPDAAVQQNHLINMPHLQLLQSQSGNLTKVSLALPNIVVPNDAPLLENFLRAANNLINLTLVISNCSQMLNLNYLSEPGLLPRVKVLEIYDTNKNAAQIDPEFLQNFPHPETLEGIGLNGKYLTKDHLLQFFQNFRQGGNALEKLTLLDGLSCDNEMMKVIIEKFDKMREIKINDSPTLGDVGLTGLAEKLVKKVNFDKSYGFFLEKESKREEPTERLTTNISQLKHITKLDFEGCPKVTDLSLIVAFQFEHLREVNLSRCVYVTNVGLQWMAKKNPALEKVTIIKNSRVDYNGVSSMIRTRPTISTVFSTLKNLQVGAGDFATDVHNNLVVSKIFLGKKKPLYQI